MTPLEQLVLELEKEFKALTSKSPFYSVRKHYLEKAKMYLRKEQRHKNEDTSLGSERDDNVDILMTTKTTNEIELNQEDIKEAIEDWLYKNNIIVVDGSITFKAAPNYLTATITLTK